MSCDLNETRIDCDKPSYTSIEKVRVNWLSLFGSLCVYATECMLCEETRRLTLLVSDL